MENITVQKAELLAALQKNREGHRKIFEEALDGYHKEAVRVLEGQLALAKANKKVNAHIMISRPSDQTKDYDRAILMVEMSVGDTITLSEMDFANYVMDDWSWKDQFLTSNRAYSQTAAFMADGGDLGRGR
jgi:hypothetical protein